MTTITATVAATAPAALTISQGLATIALTTTLVAGAVTGAWVPAIAGGLTAAAFALMLNGYEARPSLRIPAARRLLVSAIIPDAARAVSGTRAQSAVLV